MYHQQQQHLMSIYDLALSTNFIPSGGMWHFPTVAAAKLHLRKFEKLIAHWAALYGWENAIVTGGDEHFPITPRLGNIQTDVTPIAAATQFENDGELLIAQTWLNAELLDVLMEMRQNPGIAALVNWESQKQVALTQACAQIPIGQQLADCLRYSRHDYWVKSDLDGFMRECRQNGGSIEYRYLTFDPSLPEPGDWIEIVGRYRMIDAGSLGTFQLGQNVSFERVDSPIAK